MKFGKTLTKFREKAGLTKTEFANKLGVGMTHVSNVEKGISTAFSPERLEQTCVILGLNKEERKELIRAAMEDRNSPEELKLILEAYGKITEPSDFYQKYTTHSVPIITWEELTEMIPFSYSLIERTAARWTITEGEAEDMFDIKIISDHNHDKLPTGCLARIKVSTKAEPDQFVLVRDNNKKHNFIAQLKTYGKKKFLKFFNSHYPEIAFEEHHQILGIVTHTHKGLEKI